MYYIDPNTLPETIVEIPQYYAISFDGDYFTLSANGNETLFDPNLLKDAERRLAENYIPPLTALISIRGLDMYTAFQLQKGTMKAIINNKRYLVSLMADDFTNSDSCFFPAGVAEI